MKYCAQDWPDFRVENLPVWFVGVAGITRAVKQTRVFAEFPNLPAAHDAITRLLGEHFAGSEIELTAPWHCDSSEPLADVHKSTQLLIRANRRHRSAVDIARDCGAVQVLVRDRLW